MAMLTQNGQLTDIGSWYLGGAATGNVPSSTGVGYRLDSYNAVLQALAFFIVVLVFV